MPTPQTRYVDIPALAETFVDSIGDVSYVNEIAKLELCVTRRDATTDPAVGIANNKYPACRLVMSATTLVRLYNRLAETMEAMQKAGRITGGEPPKN